MNNYIAKTLFLAGKFKITLFIVVFTLLAFSANYIYESTNTKSKNYIINTNGTVDYSQVLDFSKAFRKSELFPQKDTFEFNLEKVENLFILSLNLDTKKSKIDDDKVYLRNFKNEIQSFIPNIKFELNITDIQTKEIHSIIS